MGDDEKVEILNPPDALKSKVGGGRGGKVDSSVLKRAETVIENLADDYINWVGADITKLEAALKELTDAKENRKAILDRIFQISHDIKGQGGSFGYPMLTVIGVFLCRYVEKLKDAGPGEIKVISLHIDAMKVTISKRLKGEGGREGAKLKLGLEKLSEKALQ